MFCEVGYGGAIDKNTIALLYEYVKHGIFFSVFLQPQHVADSNSSSTKKKKRKSKPDGDMSKIKNNINTNTNASKQKK